MPEISLVCHYIPAIAFLTTVPISSLEFALHLKGFRVFVTFNTLHFFLQQSLN